MPAALAVCAALAAGCGGVAEPSAAGGDGGALSVGVPEPLLTVRDVDRDALEIEVRVNGEPVEAERGPDGWTVRADVPEGEAVTLSIRWFETIDGEPLDLAAWSQELAPLDSARTVEIDADDLDTASFDQDGDTISNLAERRANTDPFVAEVPADDPVADADPADDGADPAPADGAPPTPLVTGPAPGEDPGLDAELNFVDPSLTAAIEIDGSVLESVWSERASFLNVTGEPLWVNRLLLIDDDDAGEPTLQDGVPDYIWFGMHDGVHLYLFVQSEARANGLQTPVRDSPFVWFDDDVLGVMFDPNLSREAALQGDDVYFAYPLVVFPGESQPPRVQFEGVLPAPPGIEYAACPCIGFRSGWEMKIPLAELGLTPGQPFGLELQIHEDKDGGGRDALYGWASPPIGRQDETFRLESPAQMGTVVLAPPG